MDGKRFLNFIKYCNGDYSSISDEDNCLPEDFAKIIVFNRLENYFANSAKINKLKLSKEVQETLLDKAQEREYKINVLF